MSGFRHSLHLQLFSQEKTEKATPKKMQESRKKGQVAKTMELPAAFILLFIFLSFLLYGGYMKEHFFRLFTVTFNDYLLMELSVDNAASFFNQLMLESMLLLAPIFIIAIVVAILGNIFQFGFMLTGDPLLMKFSKINPIEGFKRIFSMRSVIDFLKTILKMLIVGIIVYTTLWGEKAQLLNLAHLPLEGTMKFVAGLTIGIGIKIGVVLIILSLLDFFYQKYEFEKQLRMSKQDIKDEYKKSEGDPLIKGKIKERQRRMAMQRMMQDVPKADVIITNPTHYAVAIEYKAGKMEAPKIIAKGTDFVALKIREIAKQNDITLMENRPLARALYDQVEIGQTIPAELFQAVAEVLAYVYKLKGKISG